MQQIKEVNLMKSEQCLAEARNVDSSIFHGLETIWLELTEKCNLTCNHCYAQSGPSKPLFGEMGESDWLRVIEQSALSGATNIQFIGGEPTLHPGLPRFIEQAQAQNFKYIEVFTNGTTITKTFIKKLPLEKLWFSVSFYSCDPSIHASVTNSASSFEQTVRGIQSILDAGFPLRACLVRNDATEARLEETQEYLRNLGVTHLQLDKTRKIGRAANQKDDSLQRQELCGSCWKNKLCVTSSGNVHPCIMSRMIDVGSVLRNSITDIVSSQRLIEERKALFDIAASKYRADCNPHCNPVGDCNPNGYCNPDHCNPKVRCIPGSIQEAGSHRLEADCNPHCNPVGDCNPNGYCNPDHCNPQVKCIPGSIQADVDRLHDAN
jgi:MoaA/NifB/PqqE/SkfB family radical SAM enzyme